MATVAAARGIWLVVAVVAGLALIQRAGGASAWDAVVALAYALLMLLAMMQIQAVGRR